MPRLKPPVRGTKKKPMPVVHTTYTRPRKSGESFDPRVHPEMRTTPPRSIIHNFEEQVRRIEYIEGTEIVRKRQTTRHFTPPKNSIMNAQYSNARQRNLPLTGTHVQNINPVTGKPYVLLRDRRDYIHDYSAAIVNPSSRPRTKAKKNAGTVDKKLGKKKRQ